MAAQEISHQGMLKIIRHIHNVIPVCWRSDPKSLELCGIEAKESAS